MVVIAIDGPAASGKSTVAKIVASKLGYLYIDSGAMYRAVTLEWLRKYGDKSADDKARLLEILTKFDLRLEDNSKLVYLNGENISEAIRANQVSNNVSYIASFKEVRGALVDLQRKIATGRSVVMDGRDIATVVFPNAELKIYMIASSRVRALRRLKDLEAKGEVIELETLVKEIEARDKQDSERSESPLRKALGAYELDTDSLNVDEVVDKILNLQIQIQT
jgi:cytidylate kinase